MTTTEHPSGRDGNASTQKETSRVTIRPLGQPGDLGWVVMCHGEQYAAEPLGWNSDFEVLVARIVADYGETHNASREAAWIAEVDGRRAGCIFCVADPAHSDTAKLRILLVHSSARGLGVGSKLTQECVRFARAAGYAKMTLWTNDVLVSARRIYKSLGFVLVDEQRHHSFGKDLNGQNWSLAL